MSRIGRLPVAIPAGVTVEVAENNVVTVKGPKGTLTKELPVEMEIKVEISAHPYQIAVVGVHICKCRQRVGRCSIVIPR